MSDHTFNDWSAPWMDAQRKYWEAWSELTRQGLPGKPPEPPPNPWAQAFDQWARLMSSAAPSESRAWVQNLIAMNRSYLEFGEQLWKGLARDQAAPTSAAWWDWVADSFKNASNGVPSAFGSPADPMAGFATFWGMPMDNWRRVYSACSVMPGDFEKAMRHFASFVPDKSPESMLSQAFSTPALGYTREWQQEVQHLGQLWLSHFEALREYGMLLAQCTQCAAERLQEKLTTLTEAGKVPDTLRGFYDLWVDAGEETYAELANGPDYGKAQARLTNSLMAVKRQEQKMVDEVLSALNMPPRRELDTSHRRTHQLQREVWRLQEAFEDAGIQALRDEVAALRRELEGLREVAKAEQSPKPNSAAKSPRTPSRKAGA